MKWFNQKSVCFFPRQGLFIYIISSYFSSLPKAAVFAEIAPIFLFTAAKGGIPGGPGKRQ